MTKEEFKIYWENYLLLEKDVIETKKFVAFDSINYKSYSIVFQKLILAIGSEIDNTLKMISSLLGYADDNIAKYYNSIIGSNDFASIINQKVFLFKCEINDLTPISDWSTDNAPLCWTAYNRIKHNRHEFSDIPSLGTEKFYKYANLENCLKLLSFLYICELYAWKYISSGYVPIRPLSTLFYLNDNGWNKDSFTFGLTVEAIGNTLNLSSIDEPY